MSEMTKLATVTSISTRHLEIEIEAAKSLLGEIRALAGEDEAAVADTFEGATTLDGAIRAALVANIEDEAMVAGLGIEIEKFSTRKARLERRVEARLGLIEQAMIIVGWPRKDFDVATLSIGRNPPKVEYDPAREHTIPAEFWRPGEPELDKNGLKARLKVWAQATEAALGVENAAGRAAALATLINDFPADSERNEALSTALAIVEPKERADALSAIIKRFPPCAGAVLVDGGASLKIRRK